MAGSLRRSLMLFPLAFALTGTPIAAQVSSDGTLPTPTTVTQAGADFMITGGTRPGGGANLFHSFNQFSVPTGGAAIFNNATDVQTIFSRVTGGSISQIDGIIQAKGTASLFLLNPNGILFGPNASLNIGGSFVGTTARSIKFADGVEFSAVNPTVAPLLTVSVPTGLQMGQNPGTITVRGTGHTVTTLNPFTPLTPGQVPAPGLSVAPGKTLALVGGTIDFNGGILTAPQGRIELGAVAPGSPPVQISQTPQDITLAYGEGSRFQDISLRSRSLVDVSGMGAGSIQVQARQVRLTDGSLLLGQNRGFQPAGSIRVNASEGLELIGTTPDGTVGSSIHSATLGLGKSADIFVSTQRLLVQDGSFVVSRTYTPAVAGNVNINASESFQVLGFSAINPLTLSFVGSLTYGAGAAGQVNVSTGQLILRDGGYLARSNFGSNSFVGDLVIHATDFIEITGVSSVLRPSSITSNTFRSGSAGNVTINTRRLTLLNGGRVETSTLAAGNAGNVTLNVTESIEVRGAAPTLEERVSFIGSAATFSEPSVQKLLGVPPIPSGSAGNVVINTSRLSVTDRAKVTVQNQGTGNGGTLQINTEELVLNSRGSITAATASGGGGNIFLNASKLLLMRQDSVVSAVAGGTGNGGNITINSPIVAGFENSDIIANASQGRGGNIQITTQGIFGLKFRPQITLGNDITASSEFGVNGIVQVNTIGIDPNAGLIKLPVNPVDPNQHIAAGCTGTQGSEFVITGRGGIPEDPRQAIIGSDRPWVDLRNPSAFRPTSQALTPRPARLTEASAWQRNPDGGIELIAISDRSPAADHPTCGIKAGQN